MSEIFDFVKGICESARRATASFLTADTDKRNLLLHRIAENLVADTGAILAANKKDMDSAADNGVPPTMLDRLRLDETRLRGIADGVIKVAGLDDPVGTGDSYENPDGLLIRHLRVPIGVIGIIYEARPNVTADAAALCLKTGNAVVLRGGREALNSNIAIVDSIKRALRDCDIDDGAIGLITRTEHESADALMKMNGLVDVLIPRGGKGLIKTVLEKSSLPVIETGAGNCHIYVDEFADIDMAVNITLSAKISRPAVCNSAESLVVHSAAAKEFLPKMKAAFDAEEHHTVLRGCARTLEILPDITPATEDDFYTEYNDYIMSVNIVDDEKEAIDFINRHSTGHSEAIITANDANADMFMRLVDSAAVYRNASTRFTDGGVFGLGAEIGISTQKLHARGPMGLYALTTEKYFVYGNGQVR